MLHRLSSWFVPRPDPRAGLRPLYRAIVARAREPHWYREGGVADSIDGRFEMVTALTALTLLHLETLPEQERAMALLTEIFVEDMDGQLRESGIGDVVVGKHVGRMMGALGGRIGAYRDGFAANGDPGPALVRNLYRGEHPGDAALSHTVTQLAGYRAHLARTDIAALLAGDLAEESAR